MIKKINNFKNKKKYLYLSLFCLMANCSQKVSADARSDAKSKLQNEGKSIFVSLADIAKFLAPFVGAFALMWVFISGMLADGEQDSAKTKKKVKLILVLTFAVTVSAWIVSLVSNKSV